MSRIAQVFTELARHQRAALVPYVTAGDPAQGDTCALMHALVAAGADILELGVPFSDPMADGPVIQRASERAVARGVTLANVLGWVGEFRRTDSQTPIVLMGYANPIERFGPMDFTRAAADAGVDGVLIVDYPPEECAEFAGALEAVGIDPIFLVAPTSTEARMAAIGGLARGYVYYVALRGTTGANHIDLDEVKRQLPILEKYIKIPIGVGFGIRDAKSAAQVAAIADAVVVGSRIIEAIEGAPSGAAIDAAAALVGELRRAVETVQSPPRDAIA